MGWRRQRGLALAALLLLAVVTMALGVGTTGVDLLQVLHPNDVVWSLRLPRVLLGCMAGAGLAAAGVTLQAILRNELADPYVIGVSGGAALGGVLALAVGVVGAWSVPLWAFCGGIVGGVALFGLAHLGGRTDPMTLLLAGSVLNAMSAAIVTLIKTLVSATKAQEILFWLMGAIGTESPRTLWALGTYTGIALACLCLGAGALNVLALGEDEAAAQGLNVVRTRMGLFFAAALLVGAVVAVTGMVAFVGLVVPHAARRLVGADHRRLLPCAALGGAAFLVACDALARLTFLFFGTEVPAGAMTACVGGPFFLALLFRRERRG